MLKDPELATKADQPGCTDGSAPPAAPAATIETKRSPLRSRQLPADLVALFEELDRFEGHIPLPVLEKALGALTFRFDDVKAFAKFDDKHYRRNLLHEGPAYHALLLCWKPGQRSPIHDHRGSACGVRVVKGTLFETIFERTTRGHIYPTISHELSEGYVCANQDMDIHQISNIQDDDQPLVTLHIYSPPLNVMGTYSLTGETTSDYEDPVYEFSFDGGAGI